MRKKNRVIILGASILSLLIVAAFLSRNVLPGWLSSPSVTSAINIFIALALAVALVLALKWLTVLRSFWGAAFSALMVIMTLWTTKLLALVPVYGPIWSRGDVSGVIAIVVLFVMVWCLSVLLWRFFDAQHELRVLNEARRKLLGRSDPIMRSDLQTFVNSGSSWGPEKSLVRLRLRLLLDKCALHERAARLLSEQSAVDAAHLQTAYGPLRALIWSLPALGFIGTAAAMASSIKGVGTTLGGGNYANEQVQYFLTSRVIPSLADAFGITLIALASTVFCFFLLSLMYEREEWILNHTDALTLQLLSKVEDVTSLGQPGNLSDQLLAELWSLEQEISRLRSQFQQLLDGRGFSETLSTSLVAIFTELKMLRLSRKAEKQSATSSGNGTRDGNRGDEVKLLNDIVTELKQLNQSVGPNQQPARPAGNTPVV